MKCTTLLALAALASAGGASHATGGPHARQAEGAEVLRADHGRSRTFRVERTSCGAQRTV